MAMELKKFCQQAREEVDEIMSHDDGFNRLDNMDFMVLMAKHYFCQNLAMEHIWGEFRHITEGTPQSEIPHYASVHGNDEAMPMMAKTTSHAEYLTDEQMMMWVANMHNEDGTNGEHWNIETTTNAGNKYGVDFNKVSPIEFYLMLNMKYSDMYGVAKKHNVNTVEFYVDLVKAFINDKDTVPLKQKLAIYYNHIAMK